MNKRFVFFVSMALLLGLVVMTPSVGYASYFASIVETINNIQGSLERLTLQFRGASQSIDVSGDHHENAAVSADGEVPNEVIVQFRANAVPRFTGLTRDGVLNTDNAGLNSIFQQHKVAKVRRLWDREVDPRDAALMSRFGLDRTYVLELKDGPTRRAIEALKAHASVFYAEPNGLVLSQAVPNDPRYGEQWAWNKIQAPQAWDIETGKGVLIAVVDTGVDYTHPDLAANMWKNPKEIPDNGIDDDKNGFIDDVYGYNFVNNTGNPFDDHGHGTHVAGTVAAITNNGLGVAGTCWNCKIMAVKFLSSGGSGTHENGAKSLIYAANMGAKIISNSWGGSGVSAAVQDAVNYATSKGALVISAAGNSNSNSPLYPAAYPNSMAIGSTDSVDRRSSFSTYGSWIDVAAPGTAILSTVPRGSCSLCDSSGYRSLSGTSMATPHVSGVAGLILSKNPTWTNKQVWSALRNSVDLITFDQYIGKGRLNALKALQFTNATAVIAAITSPSQLSTPTASSTLTLSGTAGGNYVLEYGSGVYPTSWTRINSGGPVTNGHLGSLNVSGLSGRYTARLVASDAVGSNDTVFGFFVDTTPPSVTITVPKEGATLSCTATVSVSATDNIGVTRVELYVDGKLHLSRTSSPYSFLVDTTKMPVGEHVLSARAYDAAGNIGISPNVNVIFDNIIEKNPPTVAITSPANNAILKGIIHVSVSATDDTGVAKVELYKNDVLFQTRTATPYTFSWDTRNDDNGQYVLMARATDLVGNIGESASITVTVDNFIDKVPPTVSFVSPVDGATVAGKGNYRIEVNASDNVGVSRVDFFVDGVYLGSSSSAPHRINWNVGKEAAGAHMLSAVAYDAAGNKGSAEITVNVTK